MAGVQGGPGFGGSGFGASGFLRSAATTAAGIAGGALLFEGIQSMFGHHAGGILGGTAMQPGLSETVVNNYYGSDPAPPAGQDYQTASFEPGGAATSDRYSPDPGAGYASNDLGSPDDVASTDDFSSGNDDLA